MTPPNPWTLTTAPASSPHRVRVSPHAAHHKPLLRAKHLDVNWADGLSIENIDDSEPNSHAREHQ